MRIAVIGAGGVGGYFGGRLAAAGNDVVFVQRGPHFQAMRDNGLKIISEHGNLDLPTVTVAEHCDGIDPVDIVLVTVKSGDTSAAAELIAPLINDQTGVISLQNGIENETHLAQHLGTNAVMGGVAYILSLISKPGVIQQSGPLARIVFGEMDGTISARAERFLQACQSAGIDVELSADIVSALWAKFIILCPHNGMTALTRMPIGPIRDDPDCRPLLVAATEEVIALAKAMRIPLDDEVVTAAKTRFDAMPAAMTSSMHYDVTHGKPLELDWLNGAVVRLADQAGIKTPVNRFIYAGLKLLKDGTAVAE